jgi:Zn-dependent protease
VLALNLSLMFFNLIPLRPLDGGAVLAGVAPESVQPAVRWLERYGTVILVIIIVTPMIRILMWPASQLILAWAGALVRLVRP